MTSEQQPDTAPKKSRKKLWIILGAVVAFLVIVAQFGGGEKASDTVVAEQETVVEEVAGTPAPATEAAPAEPEATPGQRNALRSAETYLDTSAFSHSGLIKQLEFEGYSTLDATWAADNVDVDWNEQAVKSAKAYLDTSGFSRSGLIDQLVFDGYTQEQAEHGATGAGA